MASSNRDHEVRLQFAIEIAREAGNHTLKYFQQAGVEVVRKGDNSPVTIADREAEKILRRRIAAEFPADGILGEEFGEQPGTSGFRWILDPIDGTKAFITGVPLYGTLIGVETNGQSVAGVIYVPGLEECAYARIGSGAWYVKGNAAAQPARVSRRQLADGVFLTSQVDSFAKRNALDCFHRLERAAYVTRTWGDCYGYLLVATGRAEVMVDPIMNLWDAAALQPILQEAGGTYTDWRGEPTIHRPEGLATNGVVLDEVLAITREYV